MSAPGVGPLVSTTFKMAIDDPTRIRKSKAVGALLGLTPRKYQPGETDVAGGVSCGGDEMARTALYEAANAVLSRVTRFSALKPWGMEVAKRSEGARLPRDRRSGETGGEAAHPRIAVQL
jgi:transposase